MIHEVVGDILLTKAQAVAHGVAPNDHFDKSPFISTPRTPRKPRGFGLSPSNPGHPKTKI